MDENGKNIPGQIKAETLVVKMQWMDCTEVGGQCAISDDGKDTATWRVYLGKEVSISHIDIYYRTDDKPSE